jgi:uncharacterized membrane protein YheB (UPF0754 family)
LNLSQLWLYVSPPILGTIIGYYTNDIAIKMLFRPYRALYVGKRRVPFTPGLIPRNQERLAQRISDTIMGSLLTPEELQNIARRLLETERVESAILWLLRLALEQIQGDKEQKTAKILGSILRDIFGESLGKLIKVLSRREDFLKDQINQIFDQVLLELEFNEEQAKKLSEWILEIFLTPDTLRMAIVDFLTDRNIQVIDEGFRERSSGTYWVVANLFGLRNSLTRLRNFCLDEPQIANENFQDLVQQLKLQSRLQEWLQNLSLQNLPVSTVRQLRKTIQETVRKYLQEQGQGLLVKLNQSMDWENTAKLLIGRLKNSSVIDTSLEVVSQELALILDRYLEQDLETLMAQAIPILSLDKVIIERVKNTSAENLENGIQGIVKSELQAIVNLGGILGFMVGLLQTAILFFRT